MKFSLIIPVFNVASYLRTCIDSILTQSCPDFEVVCVDDGSTDGCGQILDEYARKDPRVAVIHKSNGGVASARNVGIENARGEWLWFVDADDMIHPNALEWLAGVMKVCEEAETICFTTEQEDTVDYANWPDLPDVRSARVSFVRNSDAFRMHRRAAWGVVLRRRSLVSIRFMPYALGEDALFHLTLFWNIARWVLLPAPLYYYRFRGNSAVNCQPDRKTVSDLMRSEVCMLRLWQEHIGAWHRDEIEGFVSWNRDFVWYTFNGLFFRLAAGDRQALLGDWLHVQMLHQRIFHEVLYRRLAVWLIRFTHSQFICRLLVCGPVVVRKYIRR